ncbi:MAG: PAS-domain containing protein [Acetobacteraceae bacterium]
MSAIGNRASASQLREIIESLPQGLLVFGPDRRVILANRAYGRVMTGTRAIPGKHIEDLLRESIGAGEYGPGNPDLLLARLLAYDATRPQTRRRRRPNGVILETRWAPLADGGFMILYSDITALAGAEEALARRGEETEILLAGMHHGLILWGPDQRLLAANPMAAVLMAVSPQLLSAGRPYAELIDVLLAAGHFGSGPLAAAMAVECKGRDWSRPWARHFVNPAGRFIERRSDPVAGGMSITTYTDITEQREGEYALRRAKEAAEAASHAKSRFLATMSHELRTPLNAVIGYSDALVQEAVPAGGRVGEYAGAINEAGRRLLGLIDTLLDVTRLETGRFDLAEDVVDIAHLIRIALRQFARVAAANEIMLTAAPRDVLPAVLADRRRLGQVLHHLLANALKFTPPGGIVTVGARREGEGLVLSIVDTGMGIADADLARVFDPFTQVDGSLARRFPGAGLGLYLARALVESHGGELRLASRPGEGTNVEIRLPPHRLLPASLVPDPDARQGTVPAEPAHPAPVEPAYPPPADPGRAGCAPAGLEPAGSRPQDGATSGLLAGSHPTAAAGAAANSTPGQKQEPP